MKEFFLKSPVISKDLNEIIASQLPWEDLYGSTVLVTGANGMLPSYMAYTLLALNDIQQADIKVIGLVRNKAKAESILKEILPRKDFRLLVQDVCALQDIEGPVDYIIHGASAARPILHKTDPTATIKANLQGTFALLDLAVKKKCKGFLLMSSAEIYGQVRADIGLIGEQDYGVFDILNPRACYSEGKRAAETICAAYKAQFGINCKVARLGHIYGPGLALDDGRVQTDFAADVLAGRDIVLNSNGSAMRTYTYVSDAIAGMYTILLNGEQTAYNVANENGMISIRQLAQQFIAVRPEKNLKLVFSNSADAANYSPAKVQGLCSEALRGLGWSAKVSIAEGVGRMIENYECEAQQSR